MQTDCWTIGVDINPSTTLSNKVVSDKAEANNTNKPILMFSCKVGVWDMGTARARLSTRH